MVLFLGFSEAIHTFKNNLTIYLYFNYFFVRGIDLNLGESFMKLIHCSGIFDTTDSCSILEGRRVLGIDVEVTRRIVQVESFVNYTLERKQQNALKT